MKGKLTDFILDPIIFQIEDENNIQILMKVSFYPGKFDVDKFTFDPPTHVYYSSSKQPPSPGKKGG